MTNENSVETLAPIEEFAGTEEFTNRKQELEFFWDLADQATQRTAASYVILARKGMGKTALMLELYRQLFTQQKKVVPFFVSFADDEEKPGRAQLTLERFISKLFLTFAFQYGAFKSGKYSAPPKLPRVLAEQKEFFASCGDAFLEKQFLGHLEALETGDLENAFDQAVEFASSITSLRREAGIVMIDEFQVLTSIYDERYGKFRNVTQWFQKPAEARWCPMVISGSAISPIVETVMRGLLARRFGPYYLDPFAQPHSMEYAYRLGAGKKAKLTEEAAAQIHLLTGGTPYYIWCLFNSIGLKDKDLSTTEKVEAVYTFETTDRAGKIRRFWDGHFEAVADKVNGDKIGLQCLYQLAVAKQEIRIDEIAAQLNVPPEQVRRVLKNLEQADLIARQTGAYYYNITDPILAAYIEREYQTDIMGQPLASFLQSQLGNWRKRLGSAARLLGEAAELYTRHLLTSFAGQEIEAAAIFNLAPGNLKLPRFKKVEHRTGLVIEGEAVEFDLLAEGEETWLVEVKYRQTPVRLNDVEKFLEKLSKMEGWPTPLRPGKRIWFFSRHGFDAQASARLRELAILHSDIAGFNALCRAVGIGEVPVIN
jgi:DNA-binding Lrp family transcriptional regulator